MIQVYDKYGKIKSSGTPGAGTITSFSAGNLSPLFTTVVTSPTSTPNLAFSAVSQAQNLFYASPNGSSGVPSFRAILASDLPSLSTLYVPYTGATAALDIGQYSFNASDISGNSSSFYGSSLDFYGAGGEYNTFGIAGLYLSLGSAYLSLTPGSIDLSGALISYAGTSDSFTIPDKSGLGGTFAMLSDIPAYTVPNLQSVTGVGADTNIPMYVRDVTFPTQIYSLLSKNGLYVYTNSDQAYLTPTSLLLQTGGVINNYLAIEPGGGNRNCTFYLPIKPSGNYTLATINDIPSVSGYVPYTGATANVDLGTYGLLAEYLEVNTTPTTYTPAVGRLGWNNTDGTLEFKLKGGNVTLQIGQEQVIRVVNKTTPLINLLEADYQVCVVSGATGQRVSVRLAQADSDANSAGTLGMVTENINANQEGFITTSGQVREINTTGSLQGETWSDGDILYLSPTTAGAVTNIKPVAPYHTVIVGYVEYAHAIHGKIYVKIDNGYELDELHNVKITSPQNNDVLMYNSTDAIWENKDPFDYLDARSVAYQKHINMPIIGNAGVNNVEGVGFAVAGGTARSWVGTNSVTKTQRIGLVVATTGNLAQIRQVNNYITREDGFSIISGFNMAENATDSSVRFFIGLSTLAIFSNVEANTLLNCAGFCKLTTSNNINLVYNDNTGTATTLDLGSNFPANTVSTDKYLIYYDTVPTGIYLKIVRVGTVYFYETILTTDIPATTTALNFGAYIVDSSGANTTTGADWYGTYIRILS